MSERTLLGIKQVTEDVYENTSDPDKLGYLWFVRKDDGGELFCGTREYCDNSPDVSEYVTKKQVEDLLSLL